MSLTDYKHSLRVYLHLASTQLKTHSMCIILRHYVNCALIRVTLLSIVVFDYWQGNVILILKGLQATMLVRCKCMLL